MAVAGGFASTTAAGTGAPRRWPGVLLVIAAVTLAYAVAVLVGRAQEAENVRILGVFDPLFLWIRGSGAAASDWLEQHVPVGGVRAQRRRPADRDQRRHRHPPPAARRSGAVRGAAARRVGAGAAADGRRHRRHRGLPVRRARGGGARLVAADAAAARLPRLRRRARRRPRRQLAAELEGRVRHRRRHRPGGAGLPHLGADRAVRLPRPGDGQLLGAEPHPEGRRRLLPLHLPDDQSRRRPHAAAVGDLQPLRHLDLHPAHGGGAVGRGGDAVDVLAGAPAGRRRAGGAGGAALRDGARSALLVAQRERLLLAGAGAGAGDACTSACGWRRASPSSRC